jgi:membrane protein
MQNSQHISVAGQAPQVAEEKSAAQELKTFGARVRQLFHRGAVLSLFKAAGMRCLSDNIPRMSAALAYYTIFSLAPLLVIAIAIAGLVLGQKAAQGDIMGEIQQLIGADGAKAVQDMIASAHKPVHSTLAGLFGLATLLFGATGAFNEIHDALNNIWSAEPNKGSGLSNFIRTRFLSFGLVLILGFLLLVSLVISAGLAGLAKYAGHLLPIPAVGLHVVDLVFSVAIITVLFAMIFRMLPEVAITWGDVMIGAVITAILFTAGKFVIGFYIGKSVSASSYGAAGSLVIVIAWIYYSALILYFGAEFTRVYACQFGSHVGCDEENRSRV